MAFHKTNKVLDEIPNRDGRLYIFKFTLKCGTVLHKVGITHRINAVERMMEVLQAFFNKYRYVPQCELRRDRKMIGVGSVESHMHKILDEWHYKFNKPFSGSTEFFHSIDESVLFDYIDNFDYTDVLDNHTSMNKDDFDAICAHLKLHQDTQTQDEDKIPF